MNQYIIVRKDICLDIKNLPKMMGQVAHAAIESYSISKTENIYKWECNSKAKIILSVKGETQLKNLSEKLHLSNIPHVNIIDEGRTVFLEPTFTCIGISIIDSNELINIVKKLQLLKI